MQKYARSLLNKHQNQHYKAVGNATGIPLVNEAGGKRKNYNFFLKKNQKKLQYFPNEHTTKKRALELLALFGAFY